MVAHILIIDGTLSKLERGYETHCGKLYKLACGLPHETRRLYYDPGVQGYGIYKWWHVLTGEGINRSIERLYRRLAASYQEGDTVYLFGYSRGAYAIRVLAGLINRVGLLRPEFADAHYTRLALMFMGRHPSAERRRRFRARFCHMNTNIEFIGVWDTVKALGLPLPFLERFSPATVNFYDCIVPKNVGVARHALAYDETRSYFDPELWTDHAPTTDLVQMLFKGTHATVGGQLRPKAKEVFLGNISLHWILQEAEAAGLVLPKGWEGRYPMNSDVGSRYPTGWTKWISRMQKRDFQNAANLEKHPSLLPQDQIVQPPNPLGLSASEQAPSRKADHPYADCPAPPDCPAV